MSGSVDLGKDVIGIHLPGNKIEYVRYDKIINMKKTTKHKLVVFCENNRGFEISAKYADFIHNKVLGAAETCELQE